jgi:hypothetical protein
MDLYDVVAARRHHEETADRQEYFGPASDAAENSCRTHNPYRFISQIARAKELAGRLNELESALLSAYEKADAEYLASVHAQQEREMLVLGTAVRQDHWRDADWQVQALQQTKDVNQVNLLYTAGLYRGGLVNDEIQNLTLTVNAMQTRTGANVVEAIGEAMNIVPDFFVGAMSTFSQIPLGTKLAGLFQVIGKVMQTSADIQSTTAGLDLTQAGWQRRSDEWLHQMQNLQTEIQQVETQILGALRRRDVAQRELNNQQRQIEHAGEIQDFLRDKFTASTLYQWRVSETAALHARMYDLTLDAAREAQRAFNLERGHTTRQFLPAEPWDSLGQGLLAGERLSFALQQMDKAYHDENRRELELAKHLSLRLHLPLAYAQLRLLGHCEIDIPEWLFDVDYPGHYLRRIRSVSLTLPCVVGPYTGVHCRLTLLSSSTRISPETRPPAHRCCDAEHRNEYEPCPEDPRIVREFAARESIATSSGQNDSGLFELNFNDDRYLPSEFRGAASRWRLDLPQENNFFDPDTLTDAILHLHYSARDGGDALRDAATDATRHRLPGDGLRFFEVSQDFPDAWAALHSRSEAPAEHRRLDLSFVSAMFPYVPGRRTRTINQLAIILDAGAAAEGDHHLVRLHHGEAPATSEGVCVRDGDGRGVFIGVIDLTDCPLGPIDDRRPAPCALEIPRALRHADRIFVIARYAAPACERD